MATKALNHLPININSLNQWEEAFSRNTVNVKSDIYFDFFERHTTSEREEKNLNHANFRSLLLFDLILPLPFISQSHFLIAARKDRPVVHVELQH